MLLTIYIKKSLDSITVQSFFSAFFFLLLLSILFASTRVRQNPPLGAAASDMRAVTFLKCVVTVVKKKQKKKKTCKKLQFYSYTSPHSASLASSKYYIMYTRTRAVLSHTAAVLFCSRKWHGTFPTGLAPVGGGNRNEPNP